MTSSHVPEPYRSAHEGSFRNRPAIEKSTLCGCFYCLNFCAPSEIKEWVRKEETAICPKCGIDSIIGNSAIPLSSDFLRAMNYYWFSVIPRNRDPWAVRGPLTYPHQDSVTPIVIEDAEGNIVATLTPQRRTDNQGHYPGGPRYAGGIEDASLIIHAPKLFEALKREHSLPQPCAIAQCTSCALIRSIEESRLTVNPSATP